MQIYKPFTKKRPDESYDDFYKRDEAAKEAKKWWDIGQENRRLMGQPLEPEPDWNAWNPTPLVGTLSPSEPVTIPPPWLKSQVPPRVQIDWGPVQPVDPLPPGKGPAIDWSQQPNSIFDTSAPAQPVVMYPDQRVETLGMRPTDVWNAVKAGAEFVFENGRWVVRVGSKVLGPVGAIGAAKDLYDFSRWVDQQFADTPNPPRTKYDVSSNTILWEHPGGYWSVTPPIR